MPANAPSPIALMLSGNAIVELPLQPKKACSPIFVTLININYVFYVESFAFAHCSALTQMYALGIMHVSLDAFANTAWLQNQLSTKSQAILGGLLIAYMPEENKKVMELSDWRSDAFGIAEQAFISTDLEKIYVPSRVSAINNGAFANLTTLKNVTLNKCYG